ncbi:peptidylprolyl isomerase [Corynebacterium tapiri]|uniref:Peptidylprolyl isomerase n=1 Tax=Corynebacterium tapiri TaxID=1448266 RepID=A0A5C4U4T5_9CORY|nr:peptidylprolyl isomerase [Corynebacterium tapiri]TNL97754.1 peptidylprolyl isomerase [Corynebacterium tapiri]
MTTNKERGDAALDKLNSELKARERKQKRRPAAIAGASAVALLAIAGGITFVATRDGNEATTAQDSSTAASTSADNSQYEPIALKRNQPLPETVTCTYEKSGEDANGATVPPSENVAATGTTTVTLKTNQGEIPMELDRSVSPCTVNAIEHLAKEGYYNNTNCHRITTEGIYVLQCGDPTGTGSGGPGFSFANEYPTDETPQEQLSSPRLYERGTIAMANSGPDTNGSQFFLNYQDSPLPPAYTYFGTITEEGLKTLDGIADKGVSGGASDGQPAEQVIIETAEVA